MPTESEKSNKALKKNLYAINSSQRRQWRYINYKTTCNKWIWLLQSFGGNSDGEISNGKKLYNIGHWSLSNPLLRPIFIVARKIAVLLKRKSSWWESLLELLKQRLRLHSVSRIILDLCNSSSQSGSKFNMVHITTDGRLLNTSINWCFF